MMEQSGTTKKKRTRVAADLEHDLLRKIDAERAGKYGRAAFLRILVIEHFAKRSAGKRKVA